MLKQLVTGSVIVVLAAGGLVGATDAAQGAVTKAPKISMPASARAGAAFTVTVNPRGQQGRLALQRRAPSGKWRTVATKRVHRDTARATFTRREARTGTVAYRAKLGAKQSKVDRIVIRKRGGPPPQPELLMSVSANTEDVVVGQSYIVSAELVRGADPLPGRKVLIEKRPDASGAWTPLGTFTTDSDGIAQVTDSSDAPGLVFYRGTSGSLSGETLIVVYATDSMPASAGADLQVTTAGCGARIAGDDSQVNLVLQSTPAGPSTPACATKVGDFVQTTWTLDGNCTTVRFQDFSLDGTTGAVVNLTVTVDGQEMLNRDVGRLGTTGRFVVNGDPMQTVVIRMQVTAGAGGDFTGTVSEPDAVCA